MELQNHHLATTIVIIEARNILKLVGESGMKNGFYSLKVPVHKMFINCKGVGGRKFTVEKPGRHHLHQMIEVMPPVIGQVNTICNALVQYKEHRLTSVIFQPKIHNAGGLPWWSTG